MQAKNAETESANEIVEAREVSKGAPEFSSSAQAVQDATTQQGQDTLRAHEKTESAKLTREVPEESWGPWLKKGLTSMIPWGSPSSEGSADSNGSGESKVLTNPNRPPESNIKESVSTQATAAPSEESAAETITRAREQSQASRTIHKVGRDVSKIGRNLISGVSDYFFGEKTETPKLAKTLDVNEMIALDAAMAKDPQNAARLLLETSKSLKPEDAKDLLLFIEQNDFSKLDRLQASEYKTAISHMNAEQIARLEKFNQRVKSGDFALGLRDVNDSERWLKNASREARDAYATRVLEMSKEDSDKWFAKYGTARASSQALWSHLMDVDPKKTQDWWDKVGTDTAGRQQRDAMLHYPYSQLVDWAQNDGAAKASAEQKAELITSQKKELAQSETPYTDKSCAVAKISPIPGDHESSAPKSVKSFLALSAEAQACKAKEQTPSSDSTTLIPSSQFSEAKAWTQSVIELSSHKLNESETNEDKMSALVAADQAIFAASAMAGAAVLAGSAGILMTASSMRALGEVGSAIGNAMLSPAQNSKNNIEAKEPVHFDTKLKQADSVLKIAEQEKLPELLETAISKLKPEEQKLAKKSLVLESASSKLELRNLSKMPVVISAAEEQGIKAEQGTEQSKIATTIAETKKSAESKTETKISANELLAPQFTDLKNKVNSAATVYSFASKLEEAAAQDANISHGAKPQKITETFVTAIRSASHIQEEKQAKLADPPTVNQQERPSLLSKTKDDSTSSAAIINSTDSPKALPTVSLKEIAQSFAAREEHNEYKVYAGERAKAVIESISTMKNERLNVASESTKRPTGTSNDSITVTPSFARAMNTYINEVKHNREAAQSVKGNPDLAGRTSTAKAATDRETSSNILTISKESLSAIKEKLERIERGALPAPTNGLPGIAQGAQKQDDNGSKLQTNTWQPITLNKFESRLSIESENKNVFTNLPSPNKQNGTYIPGSSQAQIQNFGLDSGQNFEQVHSRFRTSHQRTSLFETSSSSQLTGISSSSIRLTPTELPRPELRFERSGHGSSGERPGRGERGERLERTERGERLERSERGERLERTERSERPDRSERGERLERTVRSERLERGELGERLERTERGERLERGERGERLERTVRSERLERGELGERLERAERGERLERGERGERSERLERSERAERAERGAALDAAKMQDGFALLPGQRLIPIFDPGFKPSLEGSRDGIPGKAPAPEAKVTSTPEPAQSGEKRQNWSDDTRIFINPDSSSKRKKGNKSSENEEGDDCSSPAGRLGFGGGSAAGSGSGSGNSANSILCSTFGSNMNEPSSTQNQGPSVDPQTNSIATNAIMNASSDPNSKNVPILDPNSAIDPVKASSQSQTAPVQEPLRGDVIDQIPPVDKENPLGNPFAVEKLLPIQLSNQIAENENPLLEPDVIQELDARLDQNNNNMGSQPDESSSQNKSLGLSDVSQLVVSMESRELHIEHWIQLSTTCSTIAEDYSNLPYERLLQSQEEIEARRLKDERISREQKEELEEKAANKKREEDATKYAAALMAARKASEAQHAAEKARAQKKILEAKMDSRLEQRKTYIVKEGDTLESIALTQLLNKRLAPLLLELNRNRISVRNLNGTQVIALRPLTVLVLPTSFDTKRYMNKQASVRFKEFQNFLEQRI